VNTTFLLSCAGAEGYHVGKSTSHQKWLLPPYFAPLWFPIFHSSILWRGETKSSAPEKLRHSMEYQQGLRLLNRPNDVAEATFYLDFSYDAAENILCFRPHSCAILGCTEFRCLTFHRDKCHRICTTSCRCKFPSGQPLVLTKNNVFPNLYLLKYHTRTSPVAMSFNKRSATLNCSPRL